MITILTYCNINVGGGHLKRSLALKNNLDKEKIKTDIYCNKSFLSSQISKKNTSLFEEYWEKINKINFGKVVIFDFPKLESEIQVSVIYSLIKNLDQDGKTVISLGHFEYISPHLTAVYDLYPKLYDTTNLANHLYGFDFLSLSSEYLNKNSSKKTNKQYDILITFGNSDPKNHTENLINNPLLNNKRVCVVIGRGINLLRKKHIKKICKSKGFNVKEDIDSLHKLFVISDLIICAFGITAFEAILLKKQLICFVHYRWQFPSAKFYSNIIGFPLFEDYKKFNLTEKIKLNFNFNNRLKQGSNNLVSRIKKHIKSDNKVDALFVFSHVGDELDALGFILKSISLGKKVGIVFMSDGLMSRYENENVKEKLVKEDVFRILNQWMESLNISIYYMFDLEDNNIQSHDHLKTTKLLEVLMERHKPKEVFTNDEKSLNLTHTHIHKLMKIVTRNKNEFKIFGTIINLKNIINSDFKANRLIQINSNTKDKINLVLNENKNYLKLHKIDKNTFFKFRNSVGELMGLNSIELQRIIYEID